MAASNANTAEYNRKLESANSLYQHIQFSDKQDETRTKVRKPVMRAIRKYQVRDSQAAYSLQGGENAVE